MISGGGSLEHRVQLHDLRRRDVDHSAHHSDIRLKGECSGRRIETRNRIRAPGGKLPACQQHATGRERKHLRIRLWHWNEKNPDWAGLKQWGWRVAYHRDPANGRE